MNIHESAQMAKWETKIPNVYFIFSMSARSGVRSCVRSRRRGSGLRRPRGRGWERRPTQHSAEWWEGEGAWWCREGGGEYHSGRDRGQGKGQPDLRVLGLPSSTETVSIGCYTFHQITEKSSGKRLEFFYFWSPTPFDCKMTSLWLIVPQIVYGHYVLNLWPLSTRVRNWNLTVKDLHILSSIECLTTGDFICDICKKGYKDGNDMVAHWKSHVKQLHQVYSLYNELIPTV